MAFHFNHSNPVYGLTAKVNGPSSITCLTKTFHSVVSFTTLILIALIGTGCNKPSGSTKLNGSKTGPPRVAVVNAPLLYFAKRIGGDDVEVFYPISESTIPALWKPSSSEVQQLQSCDLIFLNGANYSRWLQTVSLPQSKVVDTSEGFEGRLISLEESFVHRHGPKGSQSDKTLVATTWLDMDQAKQQAAAIMEALVELMPARKNRLTERYDSLAKDLTDLDRDFAKTCEQFKKTTLLANAPIYQYFARRYELNIRTIQWESVETWNDDAASEIRKLLQSNSAQHFVWDKQPSKEIQTRLAKELKLTSVVLQPADVLLGPESDWLSQIRNNLEALKTHTPKK